MEKQKIINRNIIITAGIFLFLTSLMIIIANNLISSQTSMRKYFIKNDYTSTGDLFSTLVHKPDRLFAWCCDCIRYYAIKMGITYEQLNIHLFVIIQPMLILLFFVLFLIQSSRLRKKNLKTESKQLD